MKKADLRFALVMCACVFGMVLLQTPNTVGSQSSDDRGVKAAQFVVHGKPLGVWVSRALAKLSLEDEKATVDALVSALNADDTSVRVIVADALAVLGPRATAAAKPLIQQLGHEQPWPRAAAAGALAAMGKYGVPFLIEAFKNETGGIRVRSAFVLGAIGPDAKDAVPVFEEAMKHENEVMRDRFLGILSCIAPEKYAPAAIVPQAQFDAAQASQSDDLTYGAIAGGNWPAFHGPARNAICRERGLLKSWPEEGPKLLWKLDGLGRGLSAVSIAGGRLFTMGDRPSEGDTEVQFVLAYNLQTRQLLWATPIGPRHRGGPDGPRCTPTISGGLVYALGTDGALVCLDAAGGAVRWRKSLVNDFGGKMMSGWKYSESPLIDGNKVICTPGGDKAAIVALDKLTGETIWTSTVPKLGDKGADGAAYSSVVVAQIDGVRQYVQLVGRGVIGVDAQTGRFLWGYNKVANNVANVTTPVVRGSYVFASTAYSTGAALLKIVRKGDGFEAREVYFISPKDFQNHHGGVVRIGDYIYGGHGPNRGDPACVEFGTGKVVWKERAPASGSAGVLYADGHLVFRYDRGDVVLVEATPDAFRVKGRFKPLRDKGPAWSHPVIHNGRLYLRHSDILTCYDIRAY
jgi:outer membrane protein assembly factor BamB